MKRRLLHLGLVLAATAAIAPAASAQATPYIPPVNLNDVAIKAEQGSYGYTTYSFSDGCATWNASDPAGANTKWSASTESGMNVFQWSYQTAYSQTNDWLFLPDMQLEAAQYDISFVCWRYSRGYVEKFNMTLGKGKNVDAHTGAGKTDVCAMVIDSSDTEDKNEFTQPRAFTYRVTVPEGGIYNIGLQAVSDRNTYYFYIGGLTITKVDAASPAAATISATALGLDATVTVTFPTTDVSGNPIPAGTEMTAALSADGTDQTATLTGTPGSSASATLSFPKSGTHRATCVVSYTDADGLHTSEAGVSDEFTVQKLRPDIIPDGYTFTPDVDDSGWVTCTDANNDGKTFYFNPKGSGNHIPMSLNPADDEGLWVYEYPSAGDADEWLIFPAWEGSPTGAVKITYGLATYYSAPADYDLCVATSPDIETLNANVVFSETGVETSHYAASRELFAAVEPGTPYYIGIHLKTPQQPAQNAYWYAGFFRVHSESTDGTIPAQATLGEITKDLAHAGLSLTLTLPTKDVSGNDLPAENIFADIYMTGRDEPETVTGLPGTVFDRTYQELEIGKEYEFKVLTYRLVDGEKAGDRMTSGKATVEIDATYTFHAPVSFNFGNKTVFDLCTVIDSNEDQIVFSNIAGDCAKIKWNTTMPMDDWIITKDIQVDNVDELYDIILTFRNSSYGNPERCELYWGTEPTVEAMTHKVFDEVLTSANMTTFRKAVKFDEPGAVYLGIHGCSEKDKYYLEVREAGILAHETTDSDPAVPAGLAADGKISGENVAVVTFTMPATTFGTLGSADLNGDGNIDDNDRVTSPLNPDLDLVAVVKSAVETKTVTGKPGQEMSVEIAAPEGTSEITVFVQSPEYTYTPEGSEEEVTLPMGQGPKSTVSVFCGVHQPKAPVVSGQPVLADDNLGFTIAWEAVTECANEGETHLNPEGLVYRVYETVRGAEEPQLVAETAELNATVRLADDADRTMAMHIYTVKAFNGLESEESDAFAAIFGQPESLPMEDNFADGYAQGMFLVYGMGDYVDPATAGAPATESNVVLSLEPDQDLYVELPKFSTDGVDKGYVEFTFHADATTAPVTVTIEANGDAEPTVLGTLEAAEGDDGWKSVHFDYPAAMLGKKAVSVKCNTSIGAGQKFLLDSYIATNYEYVGLDNVSALAGASARGLEGAILLQGFAGHEVAVCTPDGRVVATVNADDDAVTVPAATGIYVVAADGFAAKVAVK